METIYKRSSVRTFTDEQVTDEQIEKLLRAAMAAPSAGNQQPWEFYVVRDADKRKALSKASPYAKPARMAPLVIVTCTRTKEEYDLRFEENAQQDMGAAMENLLLEAVELGLGAVWLGIAPEQERMEKVAEILEIPKGLKPFSLVAIGHPDKEVNPQCASRYDESRVHFCD